MTNADKTNIRNNVPPARQSVDVNRTNGDVVDGVSWKQMTNADKTNIRNNVLSAIKNSCGNGGEGRGESVDGTLMKESPQQVPCHLCRKRLISSTAVYCADCYVYMSKFQPKN